MDIAKKLKEIHFPQIMNSIWKEDESIWSLQKIDSPLKLKKLLNEYDLFLKEIDLKKFSNSEKFYSKTLLKNKWFFVSELPDILMEHFSALLCWKNSFKYNMSLISNTIG